MESISRPLSCENAVDGLLIFFWETRREKFLLEGFDLELGGFGV